MSCILYYSNYCESSRKLLQKLGKMPNTKEVHFICIDNREVDKSGKIHIILTNNQKIIMPESVTSVPALLLLTQNYKVLYRDEIYEYLTLALGQKKEIKVATKNNMEPMEFQDGFSSFGGSVVSDNYSFLDQSDTELSVKGNGGMRQMHSYVSLNESMNLNMHLPKDDNDYKTDKIRDDDVNMEALERRRKEELDGINWK